MSDKKQSSVEWLAQAIYDKMKMKGDGKVFQGILEQAKEMHKEEITDAYGHGSNNGYMYAMEKSIIISREQYYNETFGGQE